MNLEQARRFIADTEQAGDVLRFPCHGGQAVWHRFGQGRPLVMLHGGHGSWLHWIRNIQALSRAHEVWLPDMPGFGGSAEIPVHGMDGLVQAMLAMLDEAFADREIDLAGFSFGGLVAANIAAARPGRVRKLALLGSAGHGGPRRQTVDLVNWRHSTSQEALHAVMRGNLAAHMLADPAAIDGLALTAHIRSCEQVQFRSKGISRTWKLDDALRRVQAPVLMMWGEHDVTADPALILPGLTEGHALREGLILPGGGHWIQFESADAVDARLEAWFAG
ncbi:MAG TPA: alpha/beta fold hydrolase [Bordetella sp.]